MNLLRIKFCPTWLNGTFKKQKFNATPVLAKMVERATRSGHWDTIANARMLTVASTAPHVSWKSIFFAKLFEGWKCSQNYQKSSFGTVHINCCYEHRGNQRHRDCFDSSARRSMFDRRMPEWGTLLPNKLDKFLLLMCLRILRHTLPVCWPLPELSVQERGHLHQPAHLVTILLPLPR